MFKRIHAFLYNSFKGKLLLYISFCAVIPILVLGLSSYFISSSISKGKILSTLKLSNNQIAGSIAHRLEQIRNVTEAMDYEIYSFNNLQNVELTEYMDKFSAIRNAFHTYQRTFDLYNISVYLGKESIASEEGLMFFNLDDFYASSYYQELKSHRFNSQADFMLLTDVQFPYMIWPEPVNIISCYKVVQNMNDRKIVYGYFVNIECEELSELLRIGYSQNSGINSYIISPKGMYIAHTDDELTGTYMSDEDKLQFLLDCKSDEYESFDNAHYMVHSLDIPDCYLVLEVPDSYIFENSYLYIGTISLITLFLFIITLVAVYLVSEGLSKRIRVISSVVHEYRFSNKEDYLAKLDELLQKRDGHKVDEVDQLALHFREMMNSYEENVDNIIKMSLKEEKLQYQLLQAKINPHFLYNILDSIKSCQAMGRLDDAQAIITDLAQFYKRILKSTEDLIPIGEELEIARLYLEMESLCRNNGFTWEFIVDSDIECFLICKFTLQPLLENCVLHGLVPSSGIMSIQVLIQYEQKDETIIITIVDNGRGIAPSRLVEIQKAMEEKRMDERYYGICNVNVRLSLLTNGKSRIRLESTPNEGTKVIIKIPQML